MKIKNIIIWTILGSLFGVAFGAIAAIFANGPTVLVGIQQSWWWFALAGLLKGATDPKIIDPKVTSAKVTSPKKID